MKFIASFVFVMVLTVVGLGQVVPTPITSGRIIYSPGRLSSFEYSQFVAPNFISSGRVINSFPNRWSYVCDNNIVCRAGDTFEDGSLFGFFLEDSYRDVTVTINGTTYQNLYPSGEININRNSFTIPRFAKKKGLLFFSKPFTMSGKLRLCQVSEMSASCPPDKLVLNENVTGHGTVRITMRIKNFYNGTSRPLTTLVPESFEYKFEN